MEPRRLTGAAPLLRASLHVRFGRALRRLRVAAGAQSLSNRGKIATICAEAIVLSPYYDSVHVLTVFIGHTRAAGDPDPATLWHHIGKVVDAIATFGADAPKYEAGVRRAFTRPLTPAQFDAAFDFNYNSGAIEVAQWVKLWNAGRDAEAEASFLANWRAPFDRRALEHALFFKGQYPAGTLALQIPANDRGLLNWHAATHVDIASYFPARAA